MFKQLVAGTALSIALSATAAHAQRAHFAYTGKIVTYKVRTTGLYLIIAYGAQGGNDVLPGGTEGSGGLGAEIGGDFTLTAGTELQIAVGGKGGDARFSGGGGGGGSFVVGPDNEPLIIAGGGGGGGNTYADVPLPGHGGLTTQNATAPLGGTNGNGGKGLVGFDGGGGGGGGFYSAGADASPGGRGGGGWPGLMGGAQGGGYGGGGGTGGNICCAAGGGGGGWLQWRWWRRVFTRRTLPRWRGRQLRRWHKPDPDRRCSVRRRRSHYQGDIRRHARKAEMPWRGCLSLGQAIRRSRCCG